MLPSAVGTCPSPNIALPCFVTDANRAVVTVVVTATVAVILDVVDADMLFLAWMMLILVLVLVLVLTFVLMMLVTIVAAKFLLLVLVKLMSMVAHGAHIGGTQTEFHTTNCCHTDCTCSDTLRLL